MRLHGTLTVCGRLQPKDKGARFCGAAPSGLVKTVAEQLVLDSRETDELQHTVNRIHADIRSWRSAPKIHEQNALAAEVDRWAYLNARPNPLREARQ